MPGRRAAARFNQARRLYLLRKRPTSPIRTRPMAPAPRNNCCSLRPEWMAETVLSACQIRERSAMR